MAQILGRPAGISFGTKKTGPQFAGGSPFGNSGQKSMRTASGMLSSRPRKMPNPGAMRYLGTGGQKQPMPGVPGGVSRNDMNMQARGTAMDGIRDPGGNVAPMIAPGPSGGIDALAAMINLQAGDGGQSIPGMSGSGQGGVPDALAVQPQVATGQDLLRRLLAARRGGGSGMGA